MKNILKNSFYCLCVVLYSCTSEPDLYTYTTVIRNSSQETVRIQGYNGPGDLVFDETILSGDTSSDCIITTEAFLGLSCGINSVNFKFPNNKGYM